MCIKCTRIAMQTHEKVIMSTQSCTLLLLAITTRQIFASLGTWLIVYSPGTRERTHTPTSAYVALI